MHPQIISDKPGICPICNMKLTPKRDGTSGEGTVWIDPATRQNMGLTMTAAKYAGLSRLVHTFGEVAIPDPNVYSVTLKFDGWAERLFVAEEGERVLKGQSLLEVYSPDLVTAQKELLVALKSESNDSMTRLAEAARSRLKNWDISEDQIEQLANSGEVKRTLIIRSPADGFVHAKHVKEGDRLSARSVLYEIVDLREVWIKADVYEQDLPYIAVHHPAKIKVPGLPGRTFAGHISYISPMLDKKGQVEIRLSLENPDFALKPAMYAEVTIENALKGNRLVIPRSAIINSGVRQIVYVAKDGESYEPRTIITGAVGQNDLIEVVDGLTPGDSVVTSGQFLLDSETRLSEAVHSAGAHTQDGDKHSGHNDYGEKTDHEQMAADPYNIHTCPMPSHYHILNYGPGTCPDCGMDLVPVSETDNAPVYVCPMPECRVAAGKPGLCPVCNMRLKEYHPEGKSDQ